MDSSYPKTGRWAPIPGFEGYKASFAGEILNARKGQIKRQRRAGNGTMQVDIGKSTQMVHDLVARAFYGRPPCRGYRVKHRSDVVSDNHIENLVWSGRVPPSESMQSTSVDIPVDVQFEYLSITRRELQRMIRGNE